MFSKRLTKLLLLLAIFLPTGSLVSQTALRQLIVASGGAFSDPGDFVSLSSFDPLNQSYLTFDEVKTQAVQDVIVDGNMMFVTATDSIVSYSLETHNRIASVAAQGARYMLVSGDLLIVSIQYPVTENFVRIFNKTTLQPVNSISQVSDEAAGIIQLGNRIYVAIPGNWMSTVGKMAVLNASDGTFIEEMDFGITSSGIHDLFVFEGKVLSVNRSAWGSSSGTISVFDPVSRSLTHYSFPYNIGKGFAIHGQSLYVFLNNAIGVINLSDWTVANAELIPDPGSSTFVYFADAVLDSLNSKIYLTVTDYYSMGYGLVYDLSGNETGQFSAGISAEALALDYGNLTSDSDEAYTLFNLYPNPAGGTLYINTGSRLDFVKYCVFSAEGKMVFQGLFSDNRSYGLDISMLTHGAYVLAIISADGSVQRKPFIKL